MRVGHLAPRLLSVPTIYNFHATTASATATRPAGSENVSSADHGGKADGAKRIRRASVKYSGPEWIN
jgi:hypothetical protein